MTASIVHRCARAGVLALCFTLQANAQEQGDEDLAKQLSNPIASLISVPFQFNWDDDIGPNRDGRRFQLNFQPVVPIKLNDDWTLISRTIVPVVDQNIPFLGDGSQSGFGDIIGKQPISIGAGVRYWADGPATAPHGWGARLIVTLLFPK